VGGWRGDAQMAQKTWDPMGEEAKENSEKMRYFAYSTNSNQRVPIRKKENGKIR
jgi:hypothetical protein